MYVHQFSLWSISQYVGFSKLAFFSQGFPMLTIDLVAASGLEFLDILAAKFSDEAIEVNELLLPKSWTIFHHQLTLVFDKQFVIIMGNYLVSTLPFWRNFFLRKSKPIQTFTDLVFTKKSIMRGNSEVTVWKFEHISTIQILREIKFDNFKGSKSTI